jgi:hypothetical protein
MSRVERRAGDRLGVPGPAWGHRRYVAGVEQRSSLLTLGVADLTRARTFYERLGWHGQQVEETVFFQAGGIALVLWGATSSPVTRASRTAVPTASAG